MRATYCILFINIIRNFYIYMFSLIFHKGTLTDGCPNLGPFSKYAFGSRSWPDPWPHMGTCIVKHDQLASLHPANLIMYVLHTNKLRFHTKTGPIFVMFDIHWYPLLCRQVKWPRIWTRQDKWAYVDPCKSHQICVRHALRQCWPLCSVPPNACPSQFD